MSAEQTYATHRRLDPTYHYVLAALYLVALVLALMSEWRNPGLPSHWMLVVSLGLLIHFWKTRTYPLKAQDRVIRLEERLRMENQLPEALKTRLGDLRPNQLVALRFASDAELADRVREALDEKLGGEAIKKRIQTWRPDHFRV